MRTIVRPERNRQRELRQAIRFARETKRHELTGASCALLLRSRGSCLDRTDAPT